MGVCRALRIQEHLWLSKLLVQVQVKAELTPETKSRVGVQFKQFKLLGLIPITAPESARGKLDTTYLDDELRVSRGDRGNLFVLERYEELPKE